VSSEEDSSRELSKEDSRESGEEDSSRGLRRGDSRGGPVKKTPDMVK